LQKPVETISLSAETFILSNGFSDASELSSMRYENRLTLGAPRSAA
jgi:hypothetical protein